ncbi:ankyrin repeat domain-containing protein 16-like [Athalia rosae]|uniref:ankyrin repeat domain-containing protein 16-like n=1 Tax=Athalia rosae TaxID=37344 RepID=UPI0020336EA4|nr:ankyrin repeat domain-containing protein 16-like [Athalia rosae]
MKSSVGKNDEISSKIVGKNFLKLSQKGDLRGLQELGSKNEIADWTVYRHEVSGDTPLHLAAREGRIEVVKYLCESWNEPSFRIEVVNKDLKRPIHEAAQFARSNVVRYLIDRGASVDPLKRADWTPLMLACTKSDEEAGNCVDILLKNGASTDLKNKDGWTPLLVACRTGNVETVKNILKYSPESINVESKNGRRPLHVAAFHGNKNVMEILLSLDPGQINCKDSSGATPLFESIKSGDSSAFEYLIKSSADFKTKDNVGQTILHLAAQSGNIQVIRFILENKLVDVNCEASLGITPIMLAEKNKQPHAIEVLQKFQ